jgi:hypothetical protein
MKKIAASHDAAQDCRFGGAPRPWGEMRHPVRMLMILIAISRIEIRRAAECAGDERFRSLPSRVVDTPAQRKCVFSAFSMLVRVIG